MLRKKRFLFPALFVFILGAVFASFSLVKLTAYGQISNQTVVQNNPTKTEQPKTLINKTASTAPNVSSVVLTENLRLKDSLVWTFGGKSQRGWYLYVSLIQKTIDTDDAPDSPAFSLAVINWQTKANLKPTGVIDAETLGQMIKLWQSERLNSSQYPAEDQLLIAPVNDFYDPTRAEGLRKVERSAYAAYKRMIAAAAKDLKLKTTATGELAADEKFLKIVSSFRSREYQNQLRAASPNSGRAGLAVNSPHFTGNALDIYVGGEPVSTADANRAVQIQTPAYQWLVRNAHKFGFYPYFYEPWHWEYKG